MRYDELNQYEHEETLSIILASLTSGQMSVGNPGFSAYFPRGSRISIQVYNKTGIPFRRASRLHKIRSLSVAEDTTVRRWVGGWGGGRAVFMWTRLGPPGLCPRGPSRWGPQTHSGAPANKISSLSVFFLLLFFIGRKFGDCAAQMGKCVPWFFPPYCGLWASFRDAEKKSGKFRYALRPRANDAFKQWHTYVHEKSSSATQQFYDRTQDLKFL